MTTSDAIPSPSCAMQWGCESWDHHYKDCPRYGYMSGPDLNKYFERVKGYFYCQTHGLMDCVNPVMQEDNCEIVSLYTRRLG